MVLAEGFLADPQASVSPYIKEVLIPLGKKYDDMRGVAEKLVRKRLEKKNWSVWRGGFMNVVRQDDIYPNVKKRYEELADMIGRDAELLQYYCSVHHGMPDFICYKNNNFKFVEAKLGYEGLLENQRKCFLKLLKHGYSVEIHRLVEKQTKARIRKYNLITKEKTVKEEQLKLV